MDPDAETQVEPSIKEEYSEKNRAEDSDVDVDVDGDDGDNGGGGNNGVDDANNNEEKYNIAGDDAMNTGGVGGGDSDDDEDEEMAKAQRKRKGKKKRSHALDEEDYLLMEEQGVAVQRPIDPSGDGGDAGGGGGGGRRLVRGRKRARTDAGNVAPELGDAADEDEGDAVPMDERPAMNEVIDPSLAGRESDDDDDLGEFIVNERGEAIAHRSMRDYYEDTLNAGHATRDQLQEAEDLFGRPEDIEAIIQGSVAAESARGRDRQAPEALEGEDVEVEEGGAGASQTAAHDRANLEAMKKQFEPSVLAENFMTEKDQRLRSTDLPERLILRGDRGLQGNDPKELQEEAEWLYNQMHPPGADEIPPNQELTIKKIVKALEAIRVLGFEVPYLNSYKTSEFLPELSETDMWLIYDYDREWAKQYERKANLTRDLASAVESTTAQLATAGEGGDGAAGDATVLQEELELLQRLQDRVREASTDEELSDINVGLITRLTVIKDRAKTKAGGSEGATASKRSDKLDRLRRNERLRAFAASALLSASQYGTNIEYGTVNASPPNPSVMPGPSVIAAGGFLGPEGEPTAEWTSVDDVLAAVRELAASEIALHWKYRDVMRRRYIGLMQISTVPQKKAKGAVDAFHPLAGVMALVNKPVTSFEGDMFLRMLQAERLGFIKVDIRFHDPDPTWRQSVDALYMSDAFSDFAEAWNRERQAVLDYAFRELITPALKKEVWGQLTKAAEDYVGDEAFRTVLGMINMVPYEVPLGVRQALPRQDTHSRRRSRANDGYDSGAESGYESDGGTRYSGGGFEDESFRVVAALRTPGTGPQATWFVSLNQAGVVTDVLRLNYLTARGEEAGGKGRDPARKAKSCAALDKFLRLHSPHVIVLGATDMEARRVHEEVVRAVQRAGTGVDVLWGDLNVARIFAGSTTAKNEFPDYPREVCMAISLGRRLQDPLSEVSRLMNRENDILALHLADMQSSVHEEELLRMVSRAFEVTVAKTGVELNRALIHPWTAAKLQFVPGLGLRKATALLNNVQTKLGGTLQSRDVLLDRHLMGPVVYRNAAGFIRIRSMPGAALYGLDPLDNTRIHPDSYQLAKIVAFSALGGTTQDMERSTAVRRVMRQPGSMESLDLEAFAQQLIGSGQDDPTEALTLITAELTTPFRELRPALWRPLRPEEVFYLLVGETPASFNVGQLVTAQVTRLVRKNMGMGGGFVGIRLRLENGLSGFVRLSNLADGHVSEDEVDELVYPGLVVQARVERIVNDDLSRFGVDLITKTSALVDEAGVYTAALPRDPYYNRHWRSQLAAEIAKGDGKTRTYVKRAITHAQFKNVGRWEAEKLVAKGQAELGHVVIRPSSKGADHLNLTWRFADPDVIVHVDVEERGKEEGDVKLGPELYIQGERYEELDEVLDRYVQQLMFYAEQVQTHEKYVAGDARDLKSALKDQMRADRSRIPWGFGSSRRRAGTFRLGWIYKKEVHSETVDVMPIGLGWRGELYTSVSELVRAFKSNYKNPPPPKRRRGPPPREESRDMGRRPPEPRRDPAPVYDGWVGGGGGPGYMDYGGYGGGPPPMAVYDRGYGGPPPPQWGGPPMGGYGGGGGPPQWAAAPPPPTGMGWGEAGGSYY